MVIIITGATHTGKTLLSQKLLEKYKFPYLSIDHLKMGLIRSKNTNLTVYNDDKLTDYLWPIVSEIIKTVIENNQNLIVEGCYVPFDFKKSFSKDYLDNIEFYCIIMTKKYIMKNFDKILQYESKIEKRITQDLSTKYLINENEKNLSKCLEYGHKYFLIDKIYNLDIDNLKNT